MTVAVILTVLGFILHIWLIAEGYMIVRTYNRPAVRFQEVRFQLKRFMTFKCLPKSIQQRIITFYDFSFNGKFIRKQEINKLLGGELKRSVSAETTRQLLTGNYFFKQLPDELLNSMAYCMTEVVFLCNDVIGNGQVQASLRRKTFPSNKSKTFSILCLRRNFISLNLELLLFTLKMETKLHICMTAACSEKWRSYLRMEIM